MKRYLVAIIALLLLTVTADAAARFAVCTTTCTWDASSTAMWSASSGGATGQSVPSTSDTVTLDAATCVGGTTCTITVNTTVTVSQITMGACTATTTGCILDFSVNNNNVTLTSATAFSNTGTGTRNLKMGNGTWFINATGGTPWNMTTTTNLTFNANGSTIRFSDASNLRAMATGSAIYNNLSLDAGTLRGGVSLAAGTFNTITLNAPTALVIHNLITVTATSLVSNGISATPNLISSDFAIPNNVGTISIAAGTTTLTWTGIDGITFTGGATFVANNSMSLGTNTGITINTPTSIGSGGACILGGWLLWRDLPEHINDNFPAWIEKAG